MSFGPFRMGGEYLVAEKANNIRGASRRARASPKCGSRPGCAVESSGGFGSRGAHKEQIGLPHGRELRQVAGPNPGCVVACLDSTTNRHPAVVWRAGKADVRRARQPCLKCPSQACQVYRTVRVGPAPRYVASSLGHPMGVNHRQNAGIGPGGVPEATDPCPDWGRTATVSVDGPCA